jgi:MoxR-like ATPase
MAADAKPAVAEAAAALAKLRAEIGRALVGQAALVDRLLIGLATGGHLLLEGAPGLAKTLAAKTLAAATSLSFERIQFTPDLLPADLLGTEVYNPRTGEFTFRQGPIVAQVLLADEINRAPAKVQSALLEAMQERQITVGPNTVTLPRPFFVLATQNPLEHEGVYPLPEAQIDRFLMKVLVDYPEREDERRILRMHGAPHAATEVAAVQPVLEAADVSKIQAAVGEVYVDPALEDYILDLVAATRRPAEFGLDFGPFVSLGASPRASIGLALAGRGAALLAGRDFVTPHDVKTVAKDVLRHRLMLSFAAEVEGVGADGVLDRLLAAAPAP